mmetsp:Transcript_48440/g.139297  ORF Transcript_48440/g.139297 Transcript_48440/m.139297 type:complete len:226 (-) Transcript_48440:357-1034(-)
MNRRLRSINRERLSFSLLLISNSCLFFPCPLLTSHRFQPGHGSDDGAQGINDTKSHRVPNCHVLVIRFPSRHAGDGSSDWQQVFVLETAFGPVVFVKIHIGLIERSPVGIRRCFTRSLIRKNAFHFQSVWNEQPFHVVQRWGRIRRRGSRRSSRRGRQQCAVLRCRLGCCGFLFFLRRRYWRLKHWRFFLGRSSPFSFDGRSRFGGHLAFLFYRQRLQFLCRRSF